MKHAKKTTLSACIRHEVGALAAIAMLCAAGTVSSALAVQPSSDLQEGTSTQSNVLNMALDGNLKDASIVNNAVAMVRGNESYEDGVSGKALQLDQGAMSLGASRMLQPQDVSLSFWWKPKGTMTSEQIFMWNKALYNNDGWYLSSNADDKPLVLSVGIGSGGSGGGQPVEFNMSGDRASVFPANVWTHVMVTFDSATRQAAFYINGVKQSSSVGNVSSQGTIVADDSVKYIGLNGAHNSGGWLSGSLDEVKVWSSVATTVDVEREMLVGDPSFDARTLAQSALDAINVADSAITNIRLVTQADNGSTIRWSSDNPEIVSNTGTVVRPGVGQSDAKVTLTAVAEYGSAAVSRTFVVTVPAMSETDEYSEALLSETGMDAVQVSDEYLRNAAQKEIEYLLSFDTNRLLVEFRKQANLDTKGKTNYGGWEAGYGEGTRFTGHFVGHYLSAVSEAARATFATDEQRSQLRDKQRELVMGLRQAQQAYAVLDPTNAGFLPAFKVNALPSGADGLLVPFYDLHKVEQGLIHAYDYAQDDDVREAALAAASDFADFIVNWRQAHPDVNMLSTEYGGMNDALYQLYEITADAKHLQAAHYFDETSLFADLAANKDVLNGKHANTTIPKLTGAVQRYIALTENPEAYEALSEQERTELSDLYLKAAENFWQMTVDHHTYVIGDNSQSEHFHAADSLWQDATQNGTSNGGYNNNSTAETCNAHNMLKLTRLLLMVTKDSKYAQYYEHTFINSIVASQNPQTGMTTYFQPMMAGYPKVFGTEYGEFWCCQGTGIENFSKLNDSFYFTDEHDVYVAMFRLSTFTDVRHHARIVQSANVPKQDTVTFRVEGLDGKPVDSGTMLKLQVPTWAQHVSLTVDGLEQDVTQVDDHGWLTVPISEGTQISYRLPAKLQAVSSADNENWVAFQYGPVVLAGALTDTDPETNYSYGGVLVRVGHYDETANAMASIVPAADAQGNEVSGSAWLKNLDENVVRLDDPDDGGKLYFALRNVDGAAANIRLEPYYSLYQTTYAVYFDIADVDSPAYQDKIVAQKRTDRDAAITTDSVVPDQGNNIETTANLQHSADSQSAEYEGKMYRDARAGGWFSYDLHVNSSADHNYVSVQYNTADVNRSFDVYVDPTPLDGGAMADGVLSDAAVKLATVRVNDDAGEKAFYWEHYEIPDTLLSEKDASDIVRIKFASTGGLVGGVYGVRTLTATEYSSNANLASLSFDGGMLSPQFDGARSQYTLTVPERTTSVTAMFEVSDPGAYIAVDGIVIDDTKPRDISLDADGQTIEIVSYAQNHTSIRNYSIEVIREGKEPAQRTDPVLSYDFSQVGDVSDGSTVANLGTGQETLSGSVVNDGARLVADETYGTVLSLPGGGAGSQSPYVQIPSGLIAEGQSDLTLSVTMRWNGQGSCVYPFNIGRNNSNYLSYIVSCGGNTRMESSVAGAQTQLSGVDPSAGQWVTAAAVLQGGKTLSYYLDGVLMKRVSTQVNASDVRGTDTFSGYLGKSFYNDPYFGGDIAQFRVWNRAVSAAELFNPDEELPEPEPSHDASLRSLTIAGVAVDLQAANEGKELSVIVADSAHVDESQVVAVTSDAGATVRVDIVESVVSIVVTAEDMTTYRTYTVLLQSSSGDEVDSKPDTNGQGADDNPSVEEPSAAPAQKRDDATSSEGESVLRKSGSSVTVLCCLALAASFAGVAVRRMRCRL